MIIIIHFTCATHHKAGVHDTLNGMTGLARHVSVQAYLLATPLLIVLCVIGASFTGYSDYAD